MTKQDNFAAVTLYHQPEHFNRNEETDFDPSLGKIPLADNNLFEAIFVHVLKANDSRAHLQDLVKAKMKKVKARKIWTEVLEKIILRDANIVGGRRFLTLKNCLTPDKTANVRYVPQGFKDLLKGSLAHAVTALRPASICIILCIVAILNMRLFSHDVTQAYPQSKEKPSRRAYLCPKDEYRQFLGVGKGELLRIDKPLYGLCDSGHYWNVAIKVYIINDLQTERAVSDVSL